MPERQTSCHKMAFICPGERCIPFSYVCDGIAHCTNGADEFCNLNISRQLPEMFQCSLGKYIESKYVNDLIPDCQAGQDEPSYYFHQTPDLIDRLYCDEGKTASFSLHHICLYDLDEHGILSYCRNGAHLENCENLNCSDTFKCPKSYCIPYRMLCNGVADCLHFEDEQSCDNYTCPGMLRCKGQSFCVSQQEVCDRIVHCSQRDDEINCEICPEKCDCLNQAVVCKNKDLSATHMLVHDKMYDTGL